jgi:RHS repeat-associated protein
MRFRIKSILVLTLAIGLLPSLIGPQNRNLSSKTPGQSATLLPDGLWLLAGGEGAGGTPQAAASVWNPNTNQYVLLDPLSRPRAWHTASVLPDGTVFIFGGVGTNGKLVEDTELFDPETQTFESLSSLGLTARARHSATLLTDGRLVIAGGVGTNGSARNDAELRDFEDHTVIKLSATLTERRYNHSATLLADGRVLLSGGFDGNGNALDNGVLFDPSTERFTAASVSQIQNLKSQSQNLEVAASLPADGSVDVPLDSLIAVRFSRPLRVETVNSDTVTLSGPNGIEQIKVVPAEAGMLAFITPKVALLPGTTYTVTLNGPSDGEGFLLPVSSFSFTTESDGIEPPPDDSPPPPDPDDNPNPDDDNSQDEGNWEWKGEWKDGKPHSPWQDLEPLRAKPGVTALSGQVLDIQGRPLANVALGIEYGYEEITTLTDDSGRFLLDYIPPGVHEMLIDGRGGHNPKSKIENPKSKWGYGLFEYRLEVRAGETNVLPFTIWLPKIDAKNAATIPSPTTSEVVATTPRIPGLEVRVPAGVVIYDHEWKKVTEISITPMPIDRTPFPLPDNVIPPALFTVQPGGSYIYGGGIKLVYPNYQVNPSPPGSRLNFWHYTPGPREWYVYGQGTVTDNGRQVVPDPGIGIYRLTGACVALPGYSFGPEPPEGPCPGCPVDGEPVDLGTGLFVQDKTDLFLPDVLPIALRRTYRARDTASRPFGVGANHTFGLGLVGNINPYTFVKLILPNGGKILYNRVSSGTSYADAVFEHTSTPSIFYKSRISWNGAGWDLKLKDGTVYVFGNSAPLQSIRDRHGNQITFTRSLGLTGNITQIMSPNGRWIEFSYDGANRITQARDNSGRAVNYTYDASGRLKTVTDPAGGVTEYTYDTSHRMLTLKDARGIVFLTNQYDANGRIFRQTQADNTTFQFAYTLDANGKVTQTDITDPRGNIRRVIFNSDGYPLSDTRAVGTAEEQGVSYVREAGTNLPQSVTDALNRTTSYVYDSKGNVTRITRLAGTPQAVETEFTYEPTFNQVASITDPLDHTIDFGYDSAGNLTTVTTHPDSQTNLQTTLTYNTAGQPISITDPLGPGHATQFNYDLGDLTSVTDPLGNTTNGFTDAAGRVLSLTNPLGNLTVYEYDPLNLLKKIIDPLNGQTQLGYDQNGNLLTVTDAKNHPTAYTYNAMDRLETRTDPLLHGESYIYDENGNLTQFTDRKGQVTTYQHDALNRPKEFTYADLSTTQYVYDAGNRLLQVIDSVSGTITRTYDGLNRLTSETTPQGSISYTYDNAGRRSTMTVLGQPTVNYAYDNMNRLTQITQGSSVVNFSYDAASRRTLLTLPNGILVQYGYDTASRVTSITYKNGSTVLGDLIYGYNSAGNRTNVGGSWARTGIPEAVATTSYNAANQQLTFGDKTLAYDNNGNLTSITDASSTTLYSWNPRSQLSTISGPGMTASFAYDGFGMREKKTISGNLTEFLYEGLNPIQETSGTTVVANILTGLRVDEFLTRTEVAAGTTSHFFPDALGSALASMDVTGTLQTEYTYEPFGRTTATGAASANSFQYTGRENDITGLYYYRARYYHPALQRFISEDPLEFDAGDFNLYNYVSNSPLDLDDPLGLDPFTGMLDLLASNEVRDFSAGLGDALLFGFGDELRTGVEYLTGLPSGVNQCSGYYTAGEYSSLAVGFSRLAYAGIAKGISLAPGLTGAQASNARNILKLIFRGGLFPNYRMYPYGQLLKTYGTDAAVKIAAGRTDMPLNRAGAAIAVGAFNMSRSKCGCN